MSCLMAPCELRANLFYEWLCKSILLIQILSGFARFQKPILFQLSFFGGVLRSCVCMVILTSATSISCHGEVDE